MGFGGKVKCAENQIKLADSAEEPESLEIRVSTPVADAAFGAGSEVSRQLL